MRKAPVGVLLTVLGAATAEAQHRWEWQAHGIGTAVVGADARGQERSADFWGAGGGVALRTAGRLRTATAVSVGADGGSLGVRGEVALSFYLNPFVRTGLTPYAGGGVAVVASGRGRSEYVLIALGVEANPGGRSGWFVEGGVGGGLRVAAGVRKRWVGRER